MADQRALYTEEATGANHPTKTDVINRLTLVAHNDDGTCKVASLQSILTAQGDVVYASAANTLARLAKGTDGQILAMGAAIPEWTDIDFPVAFAAGTKIWFYQNVAPVGWTIDAVPADALLAVKGGANAYNVNGGNQAGAWTQPAHAHSVYGHTLSINQIPSHSHQIAGQPYYSAGGSQRLVGSSGGETQHPTGTAGGGGSHDHGSSGGATAATYRPLAQVGIICSKN